VNDIRVIVSKASGDHLLGKSQPAYVDGFISAFEAVYTDRRREEVLQHKFFLPDESHYSDDAYYQSASELSVANHIRLQHPRHFEVDKNVNTNRQTDVDVHFRTGPTTIDVEVKCPVEPANPKVDETGKPVLLLHSAGRRPDFPAQLLKLQSDINSSPGATAVIGKKKDNTSRDFLVHAHQKFSPLSSADDLNVLFIAGGSWGHMGDSYMHLYADGGFFTAYSFHPTTDFELVDVVVLSNLRYCHQHVRDADDWTLKNVLMIPRLNPHGRVSRSSDAIDRGLSVFEHHLRRFNSFTEVPEDIHIPENMLLYMKLHHYVNKELTREEKLRYFPVNIYQNAWP
jgi:hypothetical protein